MCHHIEAYTQLQTPDMNEDTDHVFAKRIWVTLYLDPVNRCRSFPESARRPAHNVSLTAV